MSLFQDFFSSQTMYKKDTLASYKLSRTLGDGNSAKIISAKTSSKEKVALKAFKKGHPEEFVLRELQILQRLEHRNLLRLHSCFLHRGSPILVLERCHSDVMSLIERRVRLPEPLVKNIILQVLHGLVIMHSSGMIHHDIKPENILIGYDGYIKLADFGLSLTFGEAQAGEADNLRGTLEYCAPEAFGSDNCERDGKYDVWGVGLVLYNLLTRSHPQQQRSIPEMVSISKGKKLSLPKKVKTEQYKFLRSLLTPSPELRPSASECLSSPWLKNIPVQQLDDLVIGSTISSNIVKRYFCK